MLEYLEPDTQQKIGIYCKSSHVDLERSPITKCSVEINHLLKRIFETDMY